MGCLVLSINLVHCGNEFGPTCGQLPAPVTSKTWTPPFETRIAAFEPESCEKKEAPKE